MKRFIVYNIINNIPCMLTIQNSLEQSDEFIKNWFKNKYSYQYKLNKKEKNGKNGYEIVEEKKKNIGWIRNIYINEEIPVSFIVIDELFDQYYIDEHTSFIDELKEKLKQKKYGLKKPNDDYIFTEKTINNILLTSIQEEIKRRNKKMI